MRWRQTFETVSYQKFFEAPIEIIWPVVFPATADIVVDRACSKSYIAVLEEEERARVVEDVREILNRGDRKSVV